MNFKWISTFAYSFIVSLFFIALWLLVVLASQWHEPGDSVNILEQRWLHITSFYICLCLCMCACAETFFEPGDSVNVLASNEQRWLHRLRRKIWGKQNEPHCPQTVLPSLARTLFWSWRIFNFSKKNKAEPCLLYRHDWAIILTTPNIKIHKRNQHFWSQKNVNKCSYTPQKFIPA